MRLDVVVRGQSGVDATTVSITAPRGTRLREVLPDLLGAAGVAPGAICIDGHPVSPDEPLGVPPLLHGAVLVVGDGDGGPATTSVPGRSRSTSGSVAVSICSGPDAGAIHLLPPGTHRVGRAGSDVPIDDREISRLHAWLHVGDDAANPVLVEDAGSTNGITVGRRRLQPLEVAQVGPDDVVRLGRSTMRVGLVERARDVRRHDGTGLVQVNRPPRPRSLLQRTVVTVPVRPARRESGRPPMAAMAIPLLVGIALAVVTRTATYLMFVLLSPLMLAGSWLGDRLGVRRSHRRDLAAWEGEVARARRDLSSAVSREQAWRHTAFPDLAELLGCALAHREGLWRRQPAEDEFLALRLGIGSVPAGVDVRDEQGPTGATPVDDRSRVDDVPVTVPLAATGVLGLAGPPPLVDHLARALVAQVAGWHSPRDVALVVLAPGPGWEWTRWLPHVLRHPGSPVAEARVAERRDQVDALVDELVSGLAPHDGRATRDGRRTVVLAVGGSTLRAAAGGTRLLAEGPAVGVHVICCDTSLSALPIECATTVEVVDATSAVARVVDGDGTGSDVVPDGVSRTWAEKFAHALAPLRDATPGPGHDDLPSDVRLLDLLDVDTFDPAALADAWVARPRSTVVPIGTGVGGSTFTVDLAADGPHALVAGTTGSGKSELLQTLVASLAVANRPDELVFVLIDYKGGAAFRECALLPHAVGMVTDLDDHLTRRALRSLDAELRRRERVLRDAGVPDISAYVRQSPETLTSRQERLPRLVIVLDEFAALATELPDFVHGLVGIAQRGRSLGIHLVLATQRPAGVVSADIRANTGLRLALRVADPAESVDVLESTVAASLPRSSPGRAAIRIGGDPVQVLQVARVGGHALDRQRVVVRRVPGYGERIDQPAEGRPEPSDTHDDSDLARLVTAVRAATSHLGVPAVPSPWLPPLPALIGTDDLEPACGGPAGSDGASIGLQDVPAEQRRRSLAYALAGGNHLLVVGSPGSGRTTTLRTIAGQLARLHSSADLHLHGLDAGGGLSWLRGLPQCGTVVGRHEPERMARVLQLLADDLDRRQQLLSTDGCGSLEEHRVRGLRPHLPFVVVLVDGWQPVRALLDQVDDGHPAQVLDRLLREGSAMGLRVVVSGDRDALSSRVCAGIADRILLPLGDPADYALAGVARGQVPTAGNAGRALAGRDCVETQIAVLGTDASGAGQRAALERIAAAARDREPVGGQERRAPFRVEPLPRAVDLTTLLVETSAGLAAAASPGWTLVGVGGDAVSAVGLDLCAAHPAAIVAGPPGSGRSNALEVLARWAQRAERPVLLVAGPRSPVHRLSNEPGIVVVDWVDQAEQLSSALAGSAAASSPGPLVLVDDAEQVQGTSVEPVLMSVLRQDGPGAGAAIVLAGTTTDLAAAFRGVIAEARRSRTGLLLGPHSPVDGELLGVRVPRLRQAPPGRGLLVDSGAATPVQVARSDVDPR